MKSNCLSVASPNATPFILSVQEALLLGQSEGFNILREHLAETLGFGFCEDHEGKSTADTKPWLVIRDLLHAILAPVVALQEHAAHVAQESLRTGRQSDLEYAFHGKGRNAFVWLQSFLASEQQWCLSTGCPACVVNSALDSEAHIRILTASCILSGIESDSDFGRPILPPLQFFIRSIVKAMHDDELWGPDYFELVEPKASALHDAIQDLMYQCQTMEMCMTPPDSPDSVVSMSFHEPTVDGMPVKRSKFAKKQAKMLKEEAQWLRSVVKNCWDSINPDTYAQPITTEFVRRLSTVSVEG